MRVMSVHHTTGERARWGVMSPHRTTGERARWGSRLHTALQVRGRGGGHVSIAHYR